MTLRQRFRRLRLYYKSLALFREAFANPWRALVFPFLGGRFAPRAGGPEIAVPHEHWVMLPTAARLSLIGAEPTWKKNKLHVVFAGHTFVMPAVSKMIGQSLREIFLQDDYRLRDLDLTGEVAIDIGAYIGDSSVALAARGARVHAFEPIAENYECLLETIEINGYKDRILAHRVGLTLSKDPQVDSADFPVVSALPYLQSRGITRAHVLKMDCEGCEYDLLRDDSLIRFLNPERILLE
ncbi:MAG: FkbM family methyltransferase, partial [Pseudomonadota bacterium]